MKTLQLPSSGTARSAFAALATATVLVAGLCATNAAQARDVSWSVGIGAPGVSVGVSNGYGYAPPAYVAAPVYHYPPPVYVQPPPVYYAPRPVYYAPPVVYAPRPNYYRGPGWDRRGNGHGYGDRNHNGRHDRGDHRGYR